MKMWIDVQQNTDEWISARLGKVTGSSISKVMANEGKSFGEPAKKLAADIAIQQITGKPTESPYSNSHMERGHAEEPIARSLYENEKFCDVSNGGFYDNGLTGCSPDGVCADGIIEIKSVIGSTQYKTIKRNSFDPSYKWQILFNLKESKKSWLDYVSFSSDFPIGKQIFIKRILSKNFNDEFKIIEKRVNEFNTLVNDIKKDINQFRVSA